MFKNSKNIFLYETNGHPTVHVYLTWSNIALLVRIVAHAYVLTWLHR